MSEPTDHVENPQSHFEVRRLDAKANAWQLRQDSRHGHRLLMAFKLLQNLLNLSTSLNPHQASALALLKWGRRDHCFAQPRLKGSKGTQLHGHLCTLGMHHLPFLHRTRSLSAL